MSLQIAKGFVQLVILLIAFECATPVFTVFDGEHSSHLTLSGKESTSSLLGTIAFTKAEEHTEQQRDKSFSIEIADFTQIATLLAQSHAPKSHHRYSNPSPDLPTPLFKLHQVFLI